MTEGLYAQGVFAVNEDGMIIATENTNRHIDGKWHKEETQYDLGEYVSKYMPAFTRRASRTRGTGSEPGISSDGVPRDKPDGLRPGESDKVFARKKGVWTDHDPPPETK